MGTKTENFLASQKHVSPEKVALGYLADQLGVHPDEMRLRLGPAYTED